jgi:methionyl-tRNA formyltransferase
MKVQILVDNNNSWIVPFVQKFVSKNERIKLIYNHDHVEPGDVLFLVSCEKKFTKLHLNQNNLVIHESDLPKGKGWSPLTWQVLEGKSKITVTLFEAGLAIDSGKIYEKIFIDLDGTELVDELRQKQADATFKLIFNFMFNFPNKIAVKQSGEATFYPKRTPKDSKLDISKTILEQFNLLRVVDNERYPAYFEYEGIKYILKIEKDV